MLKKMIYGGVAAKVLAMYARRLRREDYRAMAAMSSEAEIREYLRENTSYGEALLPGVSIEDAVRQTVDREFERLFKFMQREDHPLMRCIAQREAARAGSPGPQESALLDARYYADVFKIIKKRYKKDVALVLLEGFGGEVDMINVSSILRIKQFFPEMADETADYLIPSSTSPKLLRQLIRAPDRAAAEEIIAGSRLAKLFPCGMENLDEAIMKRAARFHLRVLRSPALGVYTPIAYLFLRRAELRSIKTLVECARYGIDASTVYIFGMEGEG